MSRAGLGLVLLLGLLTSPACADQPTQDGFVYLDQVLKSARYEVRYAGADNFVGEPIDGYQKARIILARAVALAAVEKDVALSGLALKFFDGYCPQRAVDEFRRWAADPQDIRQKARWTWTNPHCSATATSPSTPHSARQDLTLVDSATGKELDMGSPFDFFGPISHHGTAQVSVQQTRNRETLRQAMLRHGFEPYGVVALHLESRALSRDLFRLSGAVEPSRPSLAADGSGRRSSSSCRRRCPGPWCCGCRESCRKSPSPWTGHGCPWNAPPKRSSGRGPCCRSSRCRSGCHPGRDRECLAGVLAAIVGAVAVAAVIATGATLATTMAAAVTTSITAAVATTVTTAIAATVTTAAAIALGIDRTDRREVGGQQGCRAECERTGYCNNQGLFTCNRLHGRGLRYLYDSATDPVVLGLPTKCRC